jgi:hypothetical protein
MVKRGYRVTKKNKFLLFKGLRDGDSENNAAFAHKNVPYYTTPQFNSVTG